MEPEDDPEKLEVRLVLEAIHSCYGYDFRGYQEDSMVRRVRAAANRVNARHLGDLQHLLIHHAELFELVLDALTVRVTDMFRDPSFYRTFRQEVVPILRTYPQLKLWHAGCASGEEVYAMAILLMETGLYERAQIYATDVSHAALELARDGVYPRSRFGAFAESYLLAGGTMSFSAYCSEAYDHVAFREDLRRNLHFFHHNLTSDYALGEMQVIVCRNVLIYFGDRLRDRVLSIFESSLSRGGFLCLGSSEALPVNRKAAYREVSIPERIFRLRSAG